MTLSGVPLDIEIDWPFRRYDDSYQVRVGTVLRPFSTDEANFQVALSGTMSVQFPSLVSVMTEADVINAARIAIDKGEARFYRPGEHPQRLQPAYLASSAYDYRNERFSFHSATDAEIKNFILNKVYWLGFRTVGSDAGVWIADPYDAAYLGTTPHRMKQIAQVLASRDLINIGVGADFASASRKLLSQSDGIERALSTRLASADASPRTTTTLEHVEGAAQKVDASPDSRVIFLSHAAVDETLGRYLKRVIQEAIPEADVFVSSDPEDLPPGSPWVEEILKQLRAARLVLVLTTNRGINRRWVWYEAGAGWSRQRALFPCCVGKLRKGQLPPPFSLFTGLNIDDVSDFLTLLNTVAKELGVLVGKVDAHATVVELTRLEGEAAAACGE